MYGIITSTNLDITSGSSLEAVLSIRVNGKGFQLFKMSAQNTSDEAELQTHNKGEPTCLFRVLCRVLMSTSSVRTKLLIWLRRVVWGEEPPIRSRSHLNFLLLAISRFTWSHPEDCGQ